MKIQNIKVSVFGNYSEIKTKKERTVYNIQEDRHYYKYGKEKTYRIEENYRLFNTYHSYLLSSTIEVYKGFIPANSITNYFGKKVYKTRKRTFDFIEHRNFERFRIVFFGAMAKQEFCYSKNMLQGLKDNEILRYLKEQYPYHNISNKQIFKIIKKYKKANVSNYFGQGGFISETEKISNVIAI